MKTFFLIALAVLLFLVIFQIAKAAEYVSVLKGEEKTQKSNNKINGFLLLVFLIAGLFGVWYCNEKLFHKTLLNFPSGSVEGENIDWMLWLTLAVTGLVFFITQIALFWFAFKYQEKEGKKAFYYPHNNKLEVIWTVIPAIFLTMLVVFGLRYWFQITADAPKDAIVVEVTGRQFNWIFRYPGLDGKLGKTFYKNISDKNSNPLGQVWDDPANMDDVMPNEMHIPVGRPVKLIINSRDVIHDVGLSAFRLKMDAVPGIPTTLWFTPKHTTKEMKEITGNPDFTYEISCDQMCGQGHFTMRGVIVVESKAEYDSWLLSQQPNYYTVFPDRKPGAAPAAADTTKKATAMIDKTVEKIEEQNKSN